MATNIWGASARAFNGGSDNATSLLGFRNFISEGNIRPLLGTNSHLSDNKILRSWQYMFFMLSYCLTCSLIGILSVTLLPDPSAAEAVRPEEEQVDNEETMEAAAHNMQGAYETYGDSSYQYVSNDLAVQQSNEYEDYASNYIAPERGHAKRYSRSMTEVRNVTHPRFARRDNTGYTRSMEQQQNGGYTRLTEQQNGGYTRLTEQQNGGFTRLTEQQNGGYTRLTEQQNGGYRRSPERQDNGYQRPMMQQGSSYSSLNGGENGGSIRRKSSQYRATPVPPAEIQNNGYPEPDDAKKNEDGGKMSTEKPSIGYSGSTEASNSTMDDTTVAPDPAKEEEDEDLIPNYGFLENSLYAQYLEFYNKQKEFFEEHFGYAKKGADKGNEDEEMNEEEEGEEEEPLEDGYTERPMDEEPPEDNYSERPMYQEPPSKETNSERPVSQQPPADSYKTRPAHPPPTHWVLIPQQNRPPFHNNGLQTYPYGPQPQQESESQRYRPQPQQQESESQRYRPQPQQQELQSLRYTDPKPQQQYPTSDTGTRNEKPPSLGNSQVSSHFQKVYLDSDDSSNGGSDPSSVGVAFSGQYSSVNGNRASENHAPPLLARGQAQSTVKPTESSYLSYKPHGEK